MKLNKYPRTESYKSNIGFHRTTMNALFVFSTIAASCIAGVYCGDYSTHGYSEHGGSIHGGGGYYGGHGYGPYGGGGSHHGGHSYGPIGGGGGGHGGGSLRGSVTYLSGLTLNDNLPQKNSSVQSQNIKLVYLFINKQSKKWPICNYV